MDTLDLRIRCQVKAKELLDHYFGDLVKEAVVDKPETLEEQFTKDLPFVIEKEFIQFLVDLKEEVYPDDQQSIEQLIDRSLKRDMIREDYELGVEKAYEKAKEVTLMEKLTKSNHKEVIYYKGLLKQFTEELLEHVTNDFLELGNTVPAK